MEKTRKRGRGVGPRLNDLQRLEIIQKYKTSSPPMSLRQLARDFGVDEKSIRRIINAAADIEARASSSAVLNMRAHVHRRPTPRFPELEKTLALWIDARERAKADISPSVIIDKAKLVARSMGISPDEFKASWGWYDKFSKRYGIRAAFINSEVQSETQEVKNLQELHKLMSQYDPEFVFTVEETSLFYASLPFDADPTEQNRVSLILSCNSTGMLKLPVSMVGKERQSRQIAMLPYLMHERAWLDRPTFGSWYSSVFVPFVRERTSKPVLLVVDGERPGHQGDFEDDGIRLVFLPPLSATPESTTNLKTWWCRPLDMGVIAALKTRYKYLLVQSVLSYHNAPEEVKTALKAAEESDRGGGVHFGHSATLLDAARFVEQAWSQVPNDLLESCFARANLVPPSKLLAFPDPPVRMNALEEQVKASMRNTDSVVDKIEKLLVSSSLPASVWGLSDQHPPTNLKDRIRAFMHLDDENSPELQRQLQGEINEVLIDATSSVPAVDSTISVLSTDANERDTDETNVRKSVESQIRGLLLGITDITTRLRLLPRSGADAVKLAPFQLEGCIAAADQIRHCMQVFDNTLHKESKSGRKHEKCSREPSNKYVAE